MNFTFENRREILKLINNKQLIVKFAVECAKLVSHLSNNSKAKLIIKAVENWIANPTEENRVTTATIDDPRINSNVAYYAAVSAAYSVAYSVDSDLVVNDDVADITDWVADAAHYAVKADPNVKPKVVKLLKETYLQSLPEDERNCWLVQTTVGV